MTTALWIALIVACVGSYALKLAGVSLPESVLNHPTVQRVAGFLPVAMLSALVAVELFDGGGRYATDWRPRRRGGRRRRAAAARRRPRRVLVAIVVTAVLRLVTGSCRLGTAMAKRQQTGGTPATSALSEAGVRFTLHPYDHNSSPQTTAPGFGEEAARVLGVDPHRISRPWSPMSPVSSWSPSSRSRSAGPQAVGRRARREACRAGRSRGGGPEQRLRGAAASRRSARRPSCARSSMCRPKGSRRSTSPPAAAASRSNSHLRKSSDSLTRRCVCLVYDAHQHRPR